MKIPAAIDLQAILNSTSASAVIHRQWQNRLSCWAHPEIGEELVETSAVKIQTSARTRVPHPSSAWVGKQNLTSSNFPSLWVPHRGMSDYG
jgi:hypothetical protein